MASIDRTAYPTLAADYGKKALERDFTVTEDEIDWVNSLGRSASSRLGLCMLLKSFQALHYFADIEDIPESVTGHLRGALGLGPLIVPDYSGKHTLLRHKTAVLEFMKITACHGETAQELLKTLADEAAEVVDGRVDIINSMIDGLVLKAYELPSFSTLDNYAERAHASVQRRIVNEVASRLSKELEEKLLGLLNSGYSGRLTQFNDLKRSAGKLSKKHIDLMADQLEWLDSFGSFETIFEGIVDSKVRFFAELAKQYDAGALKDYAEPKRLTCVLALIHRMRVRTRDQLTEMLLRKIGKIHKLSKNEHQQVQIRQMGQVNKLVATLGGVVKILSDETDNSVAGEKIRDYVGSNAKVKELIEECDLIQSRTASSYLPLLWDHFIGSRAVLFRLVNLLSFSATSEDRTVLDALEVIKVNQDKYRAWLPEPIDLTFASERWRQLVRHETGTGIGIHRQSFEVCVFSHLADLIRSGDIAVDGSEDFADYRRQLLPWSECEQMLEAHCTKIGIPSTKEGFVESLQAELTRVASELDTRMPAASDDVVISESGHPSVKKVVAVEIPESAKALELEIAKRMPSRHVLDALSNIEHWTHFSRHFGPISGNEAKLDDAATRYLLTIFTYGCNLGPTQAARHLPKLKVSAQMLSFVNKRHISLEMLQTAQRELSEVYLQLDLPKVWGDGTTVASDGTQYDFYEDNLLAGYHFRYRKMGAVAYRHVANNYIAVFQHFIPPGVWEAIYVIEGLMKAGLSVEADTVHSDTQGQSAAVFCFTYLFGIDLNPRIRNWKDLVLCRPTKGTKFQNIDSLFRGQVDWQLIAQNFREVMQVTLSIAAGKVSSPMVLRKLGSFSRRNKLYFAAQEIGNVIRTIYLLKWLGSRELRQEITSNTNKIEAYNGFAKWVGFGGDAIPVNEPDEQQKRLRYNDLVALAIILQNAVDMTRVIDQLRAEGYKVYDADLQFLSPYITAHIKRFGDYHMKLSRAIEQWIADSTFQSAAIEGAKRHRSVSGTGKLQPA